jgi:dTDP-4-dehydrorhamnose reductase
MRYLILGAGGMAGHIISIYLIEKGHEVYTFSRQSIKYGINITGDVKDINRLNEIVTNYQFDCVVNAVGVLNQKAEDFPAESVFINSYLPHYLAEVTKEMKTKLIHLSTDCVFSGNKGNYIEIDLKDGLSMYDRSKALG